MLRQSWKKASRVPAVRVSQLQFIQVRHGSTRHKVMSADDAVHLIQSGDTVTVGGFVTQNSPEEILSALSRRYKATQKPSGLTVVFGGGPGDWKDKGMNHFAHEGMTKRAIGGHYGQAPQLGAMAQANKIEAYNLPLGSISRMIRAAAGKLPGHITTVGYGTMADPKHGGGKINTVTKEDLVEEIEVCALPMKSSLCTLYVSHFNCAM
jgi:propionate CoA-transferase